MLVAKCALKLSLAMKNHIVVACLKRGRLNAFENISSKWNSLFTRNSSWASVINGWEAFKSLILAWGLGSRVFRKTCAHFQQPFVPFFTLIIYYFSLLSYFFYFSLLFCLFLTRFLWGELWTLLSHLLSCLWNEFLHFDFPCGISTVTPAIFLSTSNHWTDSNLNLPVLAWSSLLKCVLIWSVNIVFTFYLVGFLM